MSYAPGYPFSIDFSNAVWTSSRAGLDLPVLIWQFPYRLLRNRSNKSIKMLFWRLVEIVFRLVHISVELHGSACGFAGVLSVKYRRWPFLNDYIGVRDCSILYSQRKSTDLVLHFDESDENSFFIRIALANSFVRNIQGDVWIYAKFRKT